MTGLSPREFVSGLPTIAGSVNLYRASEEDLRKGHGESHISHEGLAIDKKKATFQFCYSSFSLQVLQSYFPDGSPEPVADIATNGSLGSFVGEIWWLAWVFKDLWGKKVGHITRGSSRNILQYTPCLQANVLVATGCLAKNN